MDPCADDVRIPVEGAVLAGTLVTPPGIGPWPSLLLVSGSGSNDRDESVCGHAPLKVIAEYFAARGYAVLRTDDRGVGESTGEANERDFDGVTTDVEATFTWLAECADVDRRRIALVGHSEGGLIAAAAAARLPVWAVVMLGGPAVPIDVLLHAQARALSEEAGATPAQMEHERTMNERVFALVSSDRSDELVGPEVESVIRESLRTWPGMAGLDEASIAATARTMAGVVCAPPYRSLLRQAPADILRRVDQPLLAFYGGKDVQVPGQENAEAFRRVLAHRSRTAVRILPEHNHLFQRATTGAISEYESLGPAPDMLALREVETWLTAIDLDLDPTA